MRYWWVNHKQTFRHEFQGHYIWSPKRKVDGSRNRFYDFLREVCPGDLILSFAHTVQLRDGLRLVPGGLVERHEGEQAGRK